MSNWVGVMDSGVGGLTVLSRLLQLAPRCNYLYLADHAYCPYGTKSFDEIKSRVLSVANFLKRQGATKLVLACNTASVFADEVRAATRLPVFDVIVPTCGRAAAVTVNKRVALLATNATVKSQVYQKILQSYGVQTFAFPCSVFVPLVENAVEQSVRIQTVQNCLKNLDKVNADTVILGCTHFPLLQTEISLCAHGAQIISCSDASARAFSQRNTSTGGGKLRLLTTGDPLWANAVAKQCGDFAFWHTDI